VYLFIAMRDPMRVMEIQNIITGSTISTYLERVLLFEDAGGKLPHLYPLLALSHVPRIHPHPLLPLLVWMIFSLLLMCNVPIDYSGVEDDSICHRGAGRRGCSKVARDTDHNLDTFKAEIDVLPADVVKTGARVTSYIIAKAET
jgi:hypothetical protein